MTQVLLIEPDRLLAKTYTAALKAASIKIGTISSAQGAITFIDREHPELIVLELQLAKHNGVEFLYELRSHSDLRQLPVIIHTVIPEDDLHLSNMLKQQLGIIKYLYKPHTTLAELTKVVQDLLSAKTPS